jgi:hemin uptake protein HemP
MAPTTDRDHAATPSAADKAGAPDPRPPKLARSQRWRSAELFGSAQEIEIEHGQAVYRLRLTALGKLILTK